jgi:hypothetical protein
VYFNGILSKVGSSWSHLGPSEPMVEPSWAILGPNSGMLGCLGASWARSGRVGHLGGPISRPSCAYLGAILSHSWAILGRFLGSLEPCWTRLGAPRASLRPSWACLRPSWVISGPFWAMLRSSWGHLGPSWGHLGPCWAHLWRIFAS